MAREFARAFYKSKAWAKCRESYIRSKNGLCETCLSKGRVTPGKIVHHKTWITPENINDPTVTLDHDKLILECQDCHNREHFGNAEVVEEGLQFDASGQLIRIARL